MKTIKQTLEERGMRHGNFTDNADVSQRLKAIVRESPQNLTPIMREALDMILHKIARICAGDPNHKDHWHDIAGYATLVEERI